MTTRSHRSSVTPAAPIRKAIEPLENRQLFAGVAASEHVFFPNPAMVAQFVHYEQAIAIDFGFINHFGRPAGQTSDSGSDSSAAAPTVSTPVATNTSTNVVTTPSADSTPTVAFRLQNGEMPPAPHAVLTSTDSQTSTDTTAPAVALVETPAPAKDAAPTAAATSTPVVLAIAQNGKVFSERAVSIKAAMAAAPTANGVANGLVSLLNQPVKTNVTEAVTVATRTHRGEQAANASEDQQIVAQAEKGPQSVTLASLPTGKVFIQPMWQRIAAGAATVVILAANWMLRRKKEQINAAAARRHA